jgi:hypothetical protein
MSDSPLYQRGARGDFIQCQLVVVICDLCFLLRRGIDLPQEAMEKIEVLLKKVDGFTEKDFKVKLGSIVEAEFRDYYAANRFGFLKEKLTAMLS